MATGTIKETAYAHYKKYGIPANSQVTITASNPCFLFINESNTEFMIAYCAGSNIVTTIAGNLPNCSVTRQGNTLIINNGVNWGINAWIMCT